MNKETDNKIIYLAFDNKNILYKIGKSTDINQRLNQLELQEKSKMELVDYFYGDSKDEKVEAIKNISNFNTIVRKNNLDTNSLSDFKITAYPTPGKNNLLHKNSSCYKELFKIRKKKLIFSKNQKFITIPLMINKSCSISIKVFNSNGHFLNKSKKYNFNYPGKYSVKLKLNNKIRPGINICLTEAHSEAYKKNQSEKFIIIIAD